MRDGWIPRLHARLYDWLLQFPGVAQVRRDERQVLLELFDRELRPEDCVLEIGSGTGFYTFELLKRVRQVTAVERSPAMAAVLRQRAQVQGARNLVIVEGDFMAFEPPSAPDAVVAIGVLDRLPHPQAFLRRCVVLARRRVIFTLPRRGLAGSFYAFWSALGGLQVCRYDEREAAALLPDYRLHCQPAGRVLPGLPALTWAVWVYCDGEVLARPPVPSGSASPTGTEAPSPG